MNHLQIDQDLASKSIDSYSMKSSLTSTIVEI